VSFTREEAKAVLGITDSAFQKAARRLQQRHLLAIPRNGFYVAVPPQYLSWEAPPPNWYIDELMRHEGRPYYVGLLKAAELHGATHHAVMEFQVVTDRQLPRIRAGRSVLAFYYRKDMREVASGIVGHKTDTGSMKISSVELTALDLVRYAHAIGGVDAAATALADLGGKIDGAKLSAMAGRFERAITQRLGYLVDRLGHAERAEALHAFLFAKEAVPWTSLEPQKRGAKSDRKEPVERNERWRVIVHRHPEIDE
jgi:predicted transcriptional regulator of viral defense system